MRLPGHLISLASLIGVLLLASPVDPGLPLEEGSSPEPADVALEEPGPPLAMLAE